MSKEVRSFSGQEKNDMYSVERTRPLAAFLEDRSVLPRRPPPLPKDPPRTMVRR